MDIILEALEHRYSRGMTSKDSSKISDDSDLSGFLKALDTVSNDVSLSAQYKKRHPHSALSSKQTAILACVDGCCKMIFANAKMHIKVEKQLRKTIPKIADRLLRQADLPMSADINILILLDELAEALTGWLPDTGVNSERLKEKLDQSVTSILDDNADFPTLAKELAEFIENEKQRIAKQEQRLIDSESGLLRTRQSKKYSTEMINRATHNKMLSKALLNFLYGPWCDSTMLLATNEGVESNAWQRAIKTTEALIRTYQPVDTSVESTRDERLVIYSLIDKMPDLLRELLVSLTYDSQAVDTALKAIAIEHAAIKSGEKINYANFRALAYDSLSPSNVIKGSKQDLGSLHPGQWFSFESGTTSTRIKLVLKLDEFKQLLFTNRNGIKILQKSFDEFSRHIADHSVKAIIHKKLFTSTFRKFFTKLVEEHKVHKQQLADRRAEFERQSTLQRASSVTEKNENHQRILIREEELQKNKSSAISVMEEKLAAAKAIAYDVKNAALVRTLTDTVDNLNVDAKLSLPDINGQTTEFTLSVRISNTDRMIFVDKTGDKFCEYNTEQLMLLLIAKKANIKGTGTIQRNHQTETIATILKREKETIKNRADLISE